MCLKVFTVVLSLNISALAFAAKETTAIIRLDKLKALVSAQLSKHSCAAALLRHQGIYFQDGVGSIGHPPVYDYARVLYLEKPAQDGILPPGLWLSLTVSLNGKVALHFARVPNGDVSKKEPGLF